MMNPLMARISLFFQLVKFEHTVFALPFAYAGMLLAAFWHDGSWPSWQVVLWVTVAMAAARTAAMGANRIIDRTIDALNPRTASREIPSGKITTTQAWGLVGISLIVLFWAALQLNPLCVILLPLAMIFLIGYGYTKRFTWLCHVWLGITDGAAAAGGWIAVTGEFAPAAWALWAVVLFWMVGLDTIYATMDHQFDLKHNIKSIPARFGIPKALRIAAVAHFITFLLLLLVGYLVQASIFYWITAIIMGMILFYEHRIIDPNDLRKVNIAFFDANMWLAITMFFGVLIDVAYRIYTKGGL